MELKYSWDHPFHGYVRIEYRIGGELVYVEYRRDQFQEIAA
ncbi:MAG: hypothetical protein AB7I37_12300 [Pirellulales bacterium]